MRHHSRMRAAPSYQKSEHNIQNNSHGSEARGQSAGLGSTPTLQKVRFHIQCHITRFEFRSRSIKRWKR
jgi:hypothetical protein